MSDPTPPPGPRRSAGEASFIDECWALADPRGAGSRRGNGAGKPADKPPDAAQEPSAPGRPEDPGGHSKPENSSTEPPLPRDPEGEREEDERFAFEERMAMAESLGMDTSPGSLAERIARWEAHQVITGQQQAWSTSRWAPGPGPPSVPTEPSA